MIGDEWVASSPIEAVLKIVLIGRSCYRPSPPTYPEGRRRPLRFVIVNLHSILTKR